LSESGTSGINRAFSWLKKALQITEKTVAPDSLLFDVRPTMDLFGWERFTEIEGNNASATNTFQVDGSTVPVGVLRYVLGASVETDAAVVTETIWLELVEETSALVGLIQPFLAIPRDGAGREVKAALMRPIVMKPGDFLRGKCNPVLAAGEAITIREIFVDIPVGEYIPAV